MLRLIPDFGNNTANPWPLIGLIIIVIIFVIIAFFVRDKQKPPAARGVILKRVKCPDCVGGKMPEEVHDSDDIQFTACKRCGGSGEILMT